MTNLVSIEGKTRPAEVNESIVKMLSDALTQAEEGKIIGLAMALVHSDGYVSSMAAETDCFYKTVGAVAQLQFSLLQEHDED